MQTKHLFSAVNVKDLSFDWDSELVLTKDQLISPIDTRPNLYKTDLRGHGKPSTIVADPTTEFSCISFPTPRLIYLMSRDANTVEQYQLTKGKFEHRLTWHLDIKGDYTMLSAHPCGIAVVGSTRTIRALSVNNEGIPESVKFDFEDEIADIELITPEICFVVHKYRMIIFDIQTRETLGAIKYPEDDQDLQFRCIAAKPMMEAEVVGVRTRFSVYLLSIDKIKDAKIDLLEIKNGPGLTDVKVIDSAYISKKTFASITMLKFFLLLTLMPFVLAIANGIQHTFVGIFIRLWTDFHIHIVYLTAIVVLLLLTMLPSMIQTVIRGTTIVHVLHCVILFLFLLLAPFSFTLSFMLSAVMTCFVMNILCNQGSQKPDSLLIEICERLFKFMTKKLVHRLWYWVFPNKRPYVMKWSGALGLICKAGDEFHRVQ